MPLLFFTCNNEKLSDGVIGSTHRVICEVRFDPGFNELKFSYIF